MARPPLTQWNPDPGDIVEPTAPQKAAGYDTAGRPPAQWFNWFWKRTSDWLDWVDSEVGQVKSFTPTFFNDEVPSSSEGMYVITGDMCWTQVRLQWDNSNPAFDASPIRVLLPYQHVSTFPLLDAYSVVDNSDFGTQNGGSVVWRAALNVSAASNQNFATVSGLDTPVSLLYGDDNPRAVSFHLQYFHNGIGSYGVETPNRPSF